jgi:TetR/AcrR family transcriptional regulator, transcriptional repressor for nem operon
MVCGRCPPYVSTSNLEFARMDGQLPQTISILEGVDALFGAMIGVFALARMKATPLMIQESVNNNFRGLFAIQLGFNL